MANNERYSARFCFLAVLLLVAVATTQAFASESSESFRADVHVRVDGRGRLAILIDRIGIGTPGLVDEALLYQATSPLQPANTVVGQNILVNFQFRDVLRRVDFVLGAGIEIVAEVDGITDLADELIVQGPNALVLRNGLGLRRVDGTLLWSNPAQQSRLPSFAEAQTEHLAVAYEYEELGSCQSGGPGSTSCSVDCAGEIFGLTFGVDCSVSCTPTFLGVAQHACCNCGGLFGGYGRCVCMYYLGDPGHGIQIDLSPNCHEPACPKR